MQVKSHELVLPGQERSVHITSLLYHPKEKKVFVGNTDMQNDLLYTFDPGSGTFESCNFRRIADKYDVKIHRSLILDDDGSLIGATAGLHGVQERSKAAGGKIFRYRPDLDTLDLVAVPVERDYIQNIVFDKQRQMVYGFTYPVGYFFRHSLETGASTCEYIGSYPHLSTIDDDGGVWGTWGSTNNLFRYDPEENEMRWHSVRLPKITVTYLPGPQDDSQADCMLNGGDGYIYIGSVSGGLFRLDPSQVSIEYLGKPLIGLRASAMALGEDGLIYVIGGMKEGTRLYTYDRKHGAFNVLGAVKDEATGQCPYITHHVTIAGGKTLYSGETDNPERSGFLWETRLD